MRVLATTIGEMISWHARHFTVHDDGHSLRNTRQQARQHIARDHDAAHHKAVTASSWQSLHCMDSYGVVII